MINITCSFVSNTVSLTCSPNKLQSPSQVKHSALISIRPAVSLSSLQRPGWHTLAWLSFVLYRRPWKGHVQLCMLMQKIWKRKPVCLRPYLNYSVYLTFKMHAADFWMFVLLFQTLLVSTQTQKCVFVCRFHEGLVRDRFKNEWSRLKQQRLRYCDFWTVQLDVVFH